MTSLVEVHQKYWRDKRLLLQPQVYCRNGKLRLHYIPVAINGYSCEPVDDGFSARELRLFMSAFHPREVAIAIRGHEGPAMPAVPIWREEP